MNTLAQPYRESIEHNPVASLKNTITAIYDDALIDARGHSSDALQAMAEVFAIDAVDPDPAWPGETGRFLARERLRAIQTELNRRERVARLSAGTGTSTTHDQRHAAWTKLAAAVRDRVDVVEVFVANGYSLHDTGKTEAHAACLLCGGDDRLVIRRGPPGRMWCRQCQWSGDAITLAMSLGQRGFRDAVTHLAGLVGAEVPR